METLRHPFEGEPHTEEVETLDGQSEFQVTVRELTPLRARLADIADIAIGSYVVLVIVGVVLHTGRLDLANLIGGTLFFSLYYGARPGLRDSWRKTTVFRLGDRHLAVLEKNKWVRFDRTLPHRFGMVQHDYAPMEKLKYEFAQRKAAMERKVLFQKPYFGDSYIICLEYLGQRHDLVTVYGRKEAAGVVARLQACDEIIESRRRQGRGAAINPGDQWGHQTGDLGEVHPTLH